jgi:hypothetical protein
MAVTNSDWLPSRGGVQLAADGLGIIVIDFSQSRSTCGFGFFERCVVKPLPTAPI